MGGAIWWPVDWTDWYRLAEVQPEAFGVLKCQNCVESLLADRHSLVRICLRTAASKPLREISGNIWEKMLHTVLKAESSSDSSSLRKLNLSETHLHQCRPSQIPKAKFGQG